MGENVNFSLERFSFVSILSWALLMLLATDAVVVVVRLFSFKLWIKNSWHKFTPTQITFQYRYIYKLDSKHSQSVHSTDDSIFYIVLIVGIVFQSRHFDAVVLFKNTTVLFRLTMINPTWIHVSNRNLEAKTVLKHTNYPF